MDHRWSAEDLRVDHRGYRAMLVRARLAPLAVQTYVHSSSTFVAWLAGGTTPAVPPLPSTPGRKVLPPVVSASDDWLWEGSVQRTLRDWLVADGWSVVSEADAALRERGVDLLLERGARQLAIELKGYPQATMRRGVNRGKPRVHHPASQAGTYFAGALQSAMRMRDALPNTEIAIGLPETSRYLDLIEKSVRSLQDLGLGVFLVRPDGSVRQEISARRR